MFGSLSVWFGQYMRKYQKVYRQDKNNRVEWKEPSYIELVLHDIEEKFVKILLMN